MERQKPRGIVSVGRGSYKVIARIRSEGKWLHRQQTLNCSLEEAKALREQFKRELREGCSKNLDSSLKNSLNGNFSTIGDLVKFYVGQKGYGGMKTQIETLHRELGSISIMEFEFRFARYLSLKISEPSARTGKVLKNSSINRFVQTARMIFGFAAKGENRSITGITQNPLHGYSLREEESRDRVLTNGERFRLYRALIELKSYLLMPVYFSLRNPIRRGDLFRLTKENLDLSRPWIHFYAAKTMKRKKRETVLPFLDSRLIEYFRSIPAECRYLFPMRKTKDGKYLKIGEIKKHWAKVLEKARIEDFHWHDLKHCAVTSVLDGGLPVLNLKTLGIQFNEKMVERYYHHDSMKVVDWYQAQQEKNRFFHQHNREFFHFLQNVIVS